jgi:hypothetical protein
MFKSYLDAKKIETKGSGKVPKDRTNVPKEIKARKEDATKEVMSTFRQTEEPPATEHGKKSVVKKVGAGELLQDTGNPTIHGEAKTKVAQLGHASVVVSHTCFHAEVVVREGRAGLKCVRQGSAGSQDLPGCQSDSSSRCI